MPSLGEQADSPGLAQERNEMVMCLEVVPERCRRVVAIIIFDNGTVGDLGIQAGYSGVEVHIPVVGDFVAAPNTGKIVDRSAALVGLANLSRYCMERV